MLLFKESHQKDKNLKNKLEHMTAHKPHFDKYFQKAGKWVNDLDDKLHWDN